MVCLEVEGGIADGVTKEIRGRGRVGRLAAESSVHQWLEGVGVIRVGRQRSYLSKVAGSKVEVASSEPKRATSGNQRYPARVRCQ